MHADVGEVAPETRLHAAARGGIERAMPRVAASSGRPPSRIGGAKTLLAPLLPPPKLERRCASTGALAPGLARAGARWMSCALIACPPGAVRPRRGRDHARGRTAPG